MKVIRRGDVPHKVQPGLYFCSFCKTVLEVEQEDERKAEGIRDDGPGVGITFKLPCPVCEEQRRLVFWENTEDYKNWRADELSTNRIGG